jgi:DME family drug/metabolite transporter
MPAEAWALSSALWFAASHVASKRGLQDTSVTAGSLLILGSSLMVLTTAVLLDPPSAVPSRFIPIFAALGLLVPALSRLATLKTVDALGPSVGIPIQNGLRPLLAVMGAAALLGESVGPWRGLGIAGIVAGGWALSRRPREARPASELGAAALPATDRAVTTGLRSTFRSGLVFPILAALAYATSDVVMRKVLRDVPEPAFAALIATGTGLTVWVLAATAVPRVRARVRVGRRAWWLVLAGGFVGAAVLSTYNALQRGDVSLVSPISSTQPLMVFILSTLFLRDLERLTLRTIVSGLVIVAGTILVAA